MLLTLLMNQTTQMDLNKSQVKVLTPKQILFDMNAMKPKARNTVFILCPDPDTIKYDRHGLSAALKLYHIHRIATLDCLAVFSARRLPLVQRTSKSAWKMSHQLVMGGVELSNNFRFC